MMAWPTIVCGVLLVAVGLVGYTQQDPEHVSPTALIPAAIGAVLMLCGALAFSDKLRKHVMHLAAMVGLLGAIGGFMPLQRQLKNSDTFDPLKPSAISGELMILICVVFVGLCVRSFIAARKARQAAARTVTG
jgi:drug/metabolite transporter (DMT)-like permease